MIKKILIANRGEIAVRVIRSCHEMGINTVAVFSEADRKSLHVRYADEAYCIGPPPSTESYLRIDKILEVAKKTKSDAIHPGYGFLSENPEFSRRIKESGLIFIGPSEFSIRNMGDKISARQIMIKAGVPVVPGTKEKILNKKQALNTVENIGLPVMIKAASGGGGKGMRLVKKKEMVWESVQAAKSEALDSFGDDSVYVEKYIGYPHHIEFQILADQHGNIIHLFERECSVQRRHQKIIEETPSPLLTDNLRQEMGKCAIDAAKAVNYEGAGTIEFLVDKDLNYYFLEMNTRLQVEHPVTENVTGIDLVKEQIKIAGGQKLSYQQNEVYQKGHSIECRIYAEDSDNNFMPSPGIITKMTEPSGIGVRIDGYVFENFEVPVFYDPLISKLITYGRNREEAINRMKRCLDEYYLTGVKTSLHFLSRIMETPDFVEGKYNTHFIEQNHNFLFNSFNGDDIMKSTEDMVAIVSLLEYESNMHQKSGNNHSSSHNPWKEFGRKLGITRL
ncbi:MAG: acetyl-CoA carboxylase biotin carboxylase subunit [Bacteroidales bacterium]|nr:acetyl-CoA carboxylase biotin carboxylase subunit [Bacteroidales bacterium]